MPDRTYLDWNATAPLRPEARAAMIAAMDVVGNPSSVHTEGRAAKMIVEKAREQVAELVGCAPDEVVFTSGATEAISLVLDADWDATGCSAFEHEAVASKSNVYDQNPYGSMPFADEAGYFRVDHMTSGFGMSATPLKRGEVGFPRQLRGLFALTAANSETGVLQPVSETFQEFLGEFEVSMRLCDATQAIWKTDFRFDSTPCEFAAASAHKIGGPKGVGALLVSVGHEFESLGGGQEKGRRSGTENVIGIAGFGAAAEAAQRDLYAGAWEPIAEMRDDLEAALRDCAGDDLTIFGEVAPRLPNTSCFAIPGWKGETQVMQLDLAGFAVSAGSACSSGKVGPSRVLKAMGFDDITASSAIRVSMGPTTTKDEVSRFIDAWTALYQRMKTRAA